MKSKKEILSTNGIQLVDFISSSQYDAVAQSMEDYALQQSIAFNKWVSELKPSAMCTVHPPSGSGACFGLYDRSMEDLFKEFTRINS
jgi:hypothetical protein